MANDPAGAAAAGKEGMPLTMEEVPWMYDVAPWDAAGPWMDEDEPNVVPRFEDDDVVPWME